MVKQVVQPFSWIKARNLSRLMLVMVCIMLPMTFAMAQKGSQRTLTGTVTDASTNEPLIGVSLSESTYFL